MENRSISAQRVSGSTQGVEVQVRKCEPGWSTPQFSVALYALQTNPHSAEALRLYQRVARFVKGRVYRVGRRRYQDLLPEAAFEQNASEVTYQMLSGALHQFRGHTLSELLGFTRTIADRTLWRAARRRIRERETLAARREEIQGWSVHTLRADQALIAVPSTPLSEADTTYLLALLNAGSLARLARALGVSRAAVTQRVQRIRGRIEKLSEAEQGTAESWLRQSAARSRARAMRRAG